MHRMEEALEDARDDASETQNRLVQELEAQRVELRRCPWKDRSAACGD